MAIAPHPFVLISDAERRRVELLIQVERARPGYLAQADASCRRLWQALPGARVASGFLALLLSAPHQGAQWPRSA
jgi:hypothetical protein